MTFEEFIAWCKDRVRDWCSFWNLSEVMEAVDIIEDVMKKRPWRREKYWKKHYESRAIQQIVMPINKRIEESYGAGK